MDQVWVIQTVHGIHFFHEVLKSSRLGKGIRSQHFNSNLFLQAKKWPSYITQINT